MAFFPKWFLFNETLEQRKLRHAKLRKQMSDFEYNQRIEQEAQELASEKAEAPKRGKHRKKKDD